MQHSSSFLALSPISCQRPPADIPRGGARCTHPHCCAATQTSTQGTMSNSRRSRGIQLLREGALAGNTTTVLFAETFARLVQLITTSLHLEERIDENQDNHRG